MSTTRYRSKHMGKITFSSKIRQLTKEQLEVVAKQCRFQMDCCKILEVPQQGHYIRIFMGCCADHDVDTTHMNRSPKKVDLTGQRFGHLIALERGPTLRCGNTTWMCREEETGIVKPVLSKHLLKGTTKSFSFGFKRGDDHCQWTGHGQISGKQWAIIKRMASGRNLAIDITLEGIWDMYIGQDRKCALSGLPIYFGETGTCPTTASLDRIDSSKGYIKGNVQWVHKRINIMKNRFSQDEFVAFCRAVAVTHPSTPIK